MTIIKIGARLALVLLIINFMKIMGGQWAIVIGLTALAALIIGAYVNRWTK